MNVNELRSMLSNMQMSFQEVKDQITFSNAEVKFDRLTIKDAVYEKGVVQLNAFKSVKEKGDDNLE